MLYLLRISGDQITSFYQYAFVSIILIVIWMLLIRWAVRATKLANNTSEMLRNQQAAVWLLIRLCEKNGVSKEDIDNIKKSFSIK